MVSSFYNWMMSKSQLDFMHLTKENRETWRPEFRMKHHIGNELISDSILFLLLLHFRLVDLFKWKCNVRISPKIKSIHTLRMGMCMCVHKNVDANAKRSLTLSTKPKHIQSYPIQTKLNRSSWYNGIIIHNKINIHTWIVIMMKMKTHKKKIDGETKERNTQNSNSESRTRNHKIDKIREWFEKNQKRKWSGKGRNEKERERDGEFNLKTLKINSPGPRPWAYYFAILYIYSNNNKRKLVNRNSTIHH